MAEGVGSQTAERPGITELELVLAMCVVSVGLGLALSLVGPLMVAAGISGLLLMYVTVRYPFCGIALYLAAEYIRPGDLFPPLESFHLSRMLVLFTAIGWFLVMRRSSRRVLVWMEESWAVLGFTVVLFLSISTAVWPGHAAGFAIDGLKTAFVFLLISNMVDTDRRLRGVLWLLVALALWLAGHAVISYMTTGQPARGATGGFLGDENDLAMALLVILPISAALFQVSAKSIVRYSAGSAFGAIIWGAVFTFSRGAFLGIVSVFSLMALVSRRRLAMVAVTLAVISCLWIVAPEHYRARVSTITHYKRDESAMGRILAWQAAGNMFRDRPFFGVGTGNFETAYGLIYKPPGSEAVWRAAHSVYYQCLGELGAFGCLFFGLMVIFSMRDLQRIRRLSFQGIATTADGRIATGMLIGLCAYLVTGIFLSALYYPHPYFIAALTVSLRNIIGKRTAGVDGGDTKWNA